MGYIETSQGHSLTQLTCRLITIWDILKHKKSLLKGHKSIGLITIWDILKQPE